MDLIDNISLTNEQNKVLFLPFNKTFLIKGVAGSGKSTIAAKRAEQILNNALENQLFSNENYRIGLFTYNKILNNYLRGKFSNLDAHIEITSVHSYIWNNYLINLNPRPTVIYEKQYREIISDCITKQIGRSIIINRGIKFLSDEFKWLKGKSIFTFNQYRTTQRKGREGKLSENEKGQIWDLYQQVNLEMKNSGLIIFDDYPLKAISDVNPAFDSLIIDEAQDLTKACLTYLNKLIKPNSESIMLLADAAQSIYTNGITWKEVGFNVKWARSYELKQNFRNPLHIHKVANCIINNISNKDDFVSNVDESNCAKRNITVKNDKVSIVLCSTVDMQWQILANLINKIVNTTNHSSSIAILVDTYEHEINLQNYLSTRGINCSIISKQAQKFTIKPTTYITTYYSVKGLEFDYVCVLNANEDIFRIDDIDNEVNDKSRKLLYTAITRAQINAIIFSSDNKYTKIINDINTDLLTIRDFRTISNA